MNSENMVKALKMAVKNRVSTKQLIHHSDRGLQYCSEIYLNTLAERINGILKNEFLIYKRNTKKELEQLIKKSIEIYNNKRPHFSLNIKTPNFMHNKKTKIL